MSTLKLNMIQRVDQLLAFAVTGLLLGTPLAFGGVVWWSRPVVVALASAIALGWLVRVALLGRWPILKSPAMPIFALAIGLGFVQLVPMPATVAGLISTRAVATNGLGVIPDRVSRDDPSFPIPETVAARSPLSLDRPATLRWIVASLACLALFWVATHFADRLGHLKLLWGCVIAAFFVNVVLGAVQLAGGVAGLYGFITPGAGPAWAPTLDDLMAAPVPSVLRAVGEHRGDRPTLAAAKALPLFQFGSMVGGAGAFLSLASLAIPLAFGLTLQSLSPRGGREGMFARIRESGQGSQVVLTLALTLAGTLLVGMMAGKRASVPFAVGIGVVGLLGPWGSGVRKTGWLATLMLWLALGGGVAIHEVTTPEVVPRVSWLESKATWRESWAIFRDFPVAGTGMGTFATVHPYYKLGDVEPNSAMSSLAQWAVESGAVGVSLAVLLGAWAVFKLPGAIRRVGTADRALCFGLVGSLLGFAMFSAIHWTVELPAVALAVAAVAGTANRWLAGGTDLFVDRE